MSLSVRVLFCLLGLGLVACSEPRQSSPTAEPKRASASPPTTLAPSSGTPSSSGALPGPTSAAAAPQPLAAASQVAAPSPVGPPSLPAAARPVGVGLERVVTGLSRPVGLAHAADSSGRLFVVEQAGLIKIVDRGRVLPAPFLDVRNLASELTSGSSERGLLGLAFHPRFRENGFFYVNYTDKRGDTQIVRYTAVADRTVADPGSARTILSQAQPFANHNGGQLAFGPDGYLYIGLGDGGSANDPHGNAQNLGTLLGKLLRLDVDVAEPYATPDDNPFRNRADARPEIWAYGLRNPWRFSFDRATGDLFIADVGQNAWEEIDVQPYGVGGANYGWNRMEGAHCRGATTCDTSGLALPVAEYGRNDGCSVTGGYVYRGSQQPSFAGTYVFGDYCSGRIWGLVGGGNGAWRRTQLGQVQGVQISSFGEDETGEVFLTGHGDGTVYRLVTEPR